MNESNENQTPREETAERVAESSPVMIMPRLAEIVHHHRQRKEYRRQLDHDRATAAAVLRGDPLPVWSTPDERDEDDTMGDSFSVAGDTTHNHYYPEPAAPPTPTPTNDDKKPSSLAKYAMIAAGLLGAGALGAGIPWLAGAYGDATTTINESQDLGVGVEVVPGGAQTEINNGG